MTAPILLCFAHRGEAQSFISRLKLSQVHDSFFTSFVSGNIHVLITGEGPYTTLPIMMAYLQKHDGRFSKIINFGIVAGIDKLTQVGQGYWIHSVYLEQEDLEFNYHSYPCEIPNSVDKTTTKKVMTVHRRVLSAEVASKLSPVAELVDREVWALGMATHFYKIPLMSFKVVSDQPKIEKEEFCHRIREKSLEFSEEFFQEYERCFQDFSAPAFELENKIENHFFPTEILNDPLFHFSVTQKHRYQNLFQKLQKKENFDFKKFVLEQKLMLSSLKVRPKDRSREFLQNLENQVNPLWTKMKEQISEDLSILNKVDIDLHQDLTLESDQCEISFEVDSAESLNLKIESLKDFSKTSFWKKRQGQFNDL